ncbi:MAG: hypothetical protein AAGA73_03080 [Pseudomonadota bacterium]
MNHFLRINDVTADQPKPKPTPKPTSISAVDASDRKFYVKAAENGNKQALEKFDAALSAQSKPASPEPVSTPSIPGAKPHVKPERAEDPSDQKFYNMAADRQNKIIDLENRALDLNQQLANLPTDSFSGYVRPDLQAELNDVYEDLEPYRDAELKTSVRELNNLVPPSKADLAHIPEAFREEVYESELRKFNEERAAIADAALADYANRTNPATADGADPFVDELLRIRDEATLRPTAPPTNPAVAADHGNFTDAEQIAFLSSLGIDLPSDPTPSQMAAAQELLLALPQNVVAPLLNPGMTFDFEVSHGGVGTPGFLPVGLGADLTVAGSAELSGVSVGPGFNQTQTLTLELDIRADAEARVGKRKTLLQRVINRFDLLGSIGGLSPGAQRLLDSSPLLKAALQGKGLPISVNYQESAGIRLSYEAVVTPEQGARIADGDITGPNILQPLEMDQGTSVLLRGSLLSQSTLGASYKKFNVEGTVTELNGLGFGVQRLDGDRVAIYAGSIDAVENEAFFGRKGLPVALHAEKTLEEHDLTYAELDLSTPEGQEAYQRFIMSGQVPDTSVDGSIHAGTRQVLDSSHSASIALRLGPISPRWEINSSNTNYAMTEFDDGTFQVDATTSLNSRTVQFNYQLDENGEAIPGHTGAVVVFGDERPTFLQSTFGGYNVDGSLSGDQQLLNTLGSDGHVQLTFSPEELIELRDQARQYVHNTANSEAEAEAIIAQEGGSFVQVLAAQDTPEDVAILMARWHDSDFVFELQGVALNTEQSLPGELQIQTATG